MIIWRGWSLGIPGTQFGQWLARPKETRQFQIWQRAERSAD